MLTVATWNVSGARLSNSQNYFDYGPENLDYFAKKLSEINADIICLQEFHHNKKRSQAQELSRILEMHCLECSEGNISHIDPNYLLGIAILSKRPLTENNCIKYKEPSFPLYWKHNGKKAVRHHKYVLYAKYNSLTIATTHLLPIHAFGYSYDQEPADVIAQNIEQDLLQLQQPCILAGDFNYDTTQTLFHNLYKKHNLRDALPVKPTTPRDTIRDHIITPLDWGIESKIIPTNNDHYLCVASIAF